MFRFTLLVAPLFFLTINEAQAKSLGEVYPQISVVSDYRLYGVSNSNRKPTVQASLHLLRPDNVYAGIWISGVDYMIPGGPSYEVDFYGGYEYDIGDAAINVGALYAWFPDDTWAGESLSFFQTTLQARKSMGPFAIGATNTWIPSGAAGRGMAWRFEGQFSYSPAQWLMLHAKFGASFSKRAQDRKYWEYGATAKWQSLAFDVTYVDTDLAPAQCLFTDWCEPSVVGRVTYNLPVLGLGSRK